MAILMTAHIAGASKELMDALRPRLGPIRKAKGFVSHVNGPVPGGWRVAEVWHSRADFDAWFEAAVKPAFAEGGPTPSITFDELYEVIVA